METAKDKRFIFELNRQKENKKRCDGNWCLAQWVD